MSRRQLSSSSVNLSLPESFGRCCIEMEGLRRSTAFRATQVGDLPSSIILEILLKLPIKSIIRCKCVCKSWRELILDAYFARTYYRNPPTTAIIRCCTSVPPDCFILEIERNGDAIYVPFNPNALDLPKEGFTTIMGSCNGLVCFVKEPVEDRSNQDWIYNSQTVYVANPLLGECMMLPEVVRHEDISDVVYGFGFSASANKYIVVRMVAKDTGPGLFDLSVTGEIFTLGVDDSWRQLADSSIPIDTCSCGIALNGVLHWVGGDVNSDFIYALDISDERGHHIQLPPGFGDVMEEIVLALWDNHLCLIDNSNELQVDIWTMKQYGMVESWTRDIIIRSCIPSNLCTQQFIPVTALSNGELLMSSLVGELIYYDQKLKKCCKLEVPDFTIPVIYSFGYKPSFFSLRDVFIRGQQSATDV